jgi:hypothetical protein
MDPVIVYVPMCVQNGSESLGLKALEEPIEMKIKIRENCLWKSSISNCNETCEKNCVMDGEVRL